MLLFLKQILMKKNIFLFAIALLFFPSFVPAQVITREVAREKAIRFLAQQNRESSTNVDVIWAPVECVDAHNAQTITHKKAPAQQKKDESAPYYVFNASDGKGYVIVSGDERAREILGYSETGSLSSETMPCGMRMLLDYYAEEIGALPVEARSETARAAKAPQKAAANRQNISTLMSCQWGQSSPYNGQCPMSANGRTIVGCAATATSQVMYYWGHQRGYNLPTTVIPAYTTRKLGLHCEELPATTFDWVSMRDKSSSDAAAAKLCRYVGQALEMDYGTDGSEAWGADIANVYRSYFGYDKHVRQVYRQDYNYEQFEEMVYNELQEGRPVVVTGSYIESDGTSWGGHSFVCDGYKASNGYYHINWGWSGQDDGYFPLSALNSSLNSYGYSNNTGKGFDIYMSCIIGIQPPVEGHEYNESEPCAAIVDLNVTGNRQFTREAPDEAFKGITLFNAVYNHLEYNTKLVAGLGLYDENGKLLEVLAEAQLGRFDRYDGFGLEFTFGNLSLGKDLKEGTYYIRSISRSPSEDTWRLSTNAEHNYITAKITDTELTLEPSVDLFVSNVKNSSSWYSSSCTATITNNGTEESRGLLYAFSSSKLLNVIQTDLAPGEAKTVTLASGSVVKVTSDFDGHHVLWTNSSSVPNIALTACAVNADENGYFEGQKLVLDVSVTNNSSTSAYGSQVSVKLCKEGSSTVVATKTFYPDVEALGIQTERLEFDGLTYNQPYTITLSSGSYTVEIGNMTTPQPRTFFVYTVTPVEMTHLLGDVNHDGAISKEDVTAMVAFILGKKVDTFSEENADVNSDEVITIADVTALVNIVLSKPN